MVDRAVGSLVGLAIGDALGTTLEFTRRDALPSQTEITGGGPFRLEPGQWTDDTSMALALADSLVECGRYDADDCIRRYVAWMDDGAYSSNGTCFDIGNTTRAALQAYKTTGRAEGANRAPDLAGNGSIMRLAPAVLFGLPDVAQAVDLAERQSMTTHGADECREACIIMASTMSASIMGETAPRTVTRTPGGRRIAEGRWRNAARADIRSTGYVIDTLEAALWADAQTDGFEKALVLAVNLGGDADTVGAVAGQIAGARHGLAGIPERWLSVLHDRDGIIAVAHRLLRAGCGPLD
jgi:ADP-ribosyl-[dinitrogen reductase] hydrolase